MPTTRPLPATLPLRVVVTDCGAEEKRSASPLEDGSDATWDAVRSHDGCSPTSDDDRSAAIPTTAELTPLDDATPATVALAIQDLTTHDDWLQQHEAITVLRQALVHHTPLVASESRVLVIVPALVFASDNLRSALSKNALLALGECCACLGLPLLRRFLVATAESDASGSRAAKAPLVDVLLRRACCEKRFLRDAASDAVDLLLCHLASPELVAAAAGYAANKNAKIVALASRLMAQSLARLRTRNDWDVAQFAADGTAGAAGARSVYEALAAFRAGKDSVARAESTASLRLLGESLGRERFETTLYNALGTDKQRHIVASIVAEVFPSVDASATAGTGRRGSLRDRMLQQQPPPTQ